MHKISRCPRKPMSTECRLRKVAQGSVLAVLLLAPALAAAEGYNWDRARHLALIESVAALYGIDPLLVRAVVKVESNFNPDAVSNKGAQGLMQLMPATQGDLGVADPFDPRQNVDGGTRYLIDLIKRYDSVRKALWAYNAGPARVDRAGPPAESRSYANQVLRTFWRLQRVGTGN